MNPKAFCCEACGVPIKVLTVLTDSMIYCELCAAQALEAVAAEERAHRIRTGWDDTEKDDEETKVG